ncbi:serine hydrolase FSH [Calycina marina]|uniref:Serine hydrolase FSH n=1 Tax=Calycina marina TaxID=1763456 RepID=A0A9P7YXW3_9HELO|nr:serine hydrolase FSH [Calycina marina]
MLYDKEYKIAWRGEAQDEFLCLHGRSASTEIFRSQTASFRTLQDDSYEFDFVDAPYACEPAAGIDLFYSPPFHSFYDPNIESIKKGHQWLLAYIDLHGPYNGAMDFCQGCALTASLLLYHLGFGVSDGARRIDGSSNLQLMENASNAAILKDGTQRWGEGFDASVKDDKSNVSGFKFEEISKECLIQTPTVHVYGARDPRYPSSMTLSRFCSSAARRTYDHGGGHDIPRMKNVSVMIRELVEWCAMMQIDGDELKSR